MLSINTTRIFLALLLGITFICYAPALKNGFTFWDDTQYVFDNPSVNALTPGNIRTIFTSYHQGNYIPLTFLSLAVDKAIFGTSPKVFIAMNIFLHLLNTLLVFVFVRSLFENRLAAVVCALLFGIHTLHVESVAWIAERKDVLYTFWFLLSLIAYLQYCRSSKGTWYLLSLLFMLFSVLSKTMGVALVFVFPLIDLVLGRNMRNAKTWAEKVPFLLVAGNFIYFGMDAVSTNVDDLSSYSLSFFERVALAGYAFFTYVLKLIIPAGLSAYYPYPMRPGEALPLWVWVFPVLLAMLPVLLFRCRKNKLFIFSALFFMFNIGMALQLFPVGDSLMGDRFVYVASLGLFIPAGLIFSKLAERKQKLLPTAILGLYAVFLCALTRERCTVWKDPNTLWSDVITKQGNVPMALVNRGNYLFQQGNYQGALSDFNNAIAEGYGLGAAYYNRGVAHFSTKQYAAAAADFSMVLKEKEDDKDALMSRALSYIYLDKRKESIADLDHYILLDTLNPDAYAKRGVMRIQTGDSTGACQDWKRASDLGSPTARNALDLYCK